MASPSGPVRFCKQCREPIPRWVAAQARYCSESCKQQRNDSLRPKLQRSFVGLDGEGIQDRYVLLAASTGQSIASLKGGLDTEECLDFLLSLPKRSNNRGNPIYVWFAFDYDVNMILGDLRFHDDDRRGLRSEIAELRGTNKCTWHGYTITYIKRKIFRVSFGGRNFTSYDSWSFFGSNFEKACGEWGVELPPIIAEGKASRKDFDKWTLKKLREYNSAEVVALAELMERLRESTKPLDIKVQGWHGPGAFASSFLGKHKIKRHIQGEELPNDVTSRAYFGGRIDIAGFGWVDPVYHYDIVSAYPSAIRNLPSLRKLKWHHGEGTPPREGLYVARIRWKIPGRNQDTNWSPFPWRNEHGIIRYPLEGEGWYWKPEIEAALQKYQESWFKFKEFWYAEGELQYPLRSLIEEAYEYRAQLKSQNDSAHYSIKLILNSLYGKFAQTVGRATYHSPIWAGLITAQTRAELTRAITEDTVLVMTDSIWSRSPLDVPTTGKLGEWEQGNETRLALAGAGLYTATDANGKTYAAKQRGFDKVTSVDIEGILNEWLHGDCTYQGCYKINRFVGMGLAMQTHLPWRHWVELERRIEPLPLVGTSKRYPISPEEHWFYLHPDYPGFYKNGMLGMNFLQMELRHRDHGRRLSYPYSRLTTNQTQIVEGLEDETEE